MIAAHKLKILQEHQARLIEELEGSAGYVLDLIRRLKTLPDESEPYADAEGELYAYALQLELDAKDLRKVMDEITDVVPDDSENFESHDE